MLIDQLQLDTLPCLELTDTVGKSLQLMEDNNVSHLPIVTDNIFRGLVFENSLENLSEEDELDNHRYLFNNLYVKADDHFLKAVQIATESSLSILPVIDENNLYAGVVTTNVLLKKTAELLQVSLPGALIVFEVEKNEFSFSEISRIVETNDAQITQFNTNFDAERGMMEVTIRISKPDVSDIIGTLQRYGYQIKFFYGEEQYTNELRSNYDNLMSYLDV